MFFKWTADQEEAHEASDERLVSSLSSVFAQGIDKLMAHMTSILHPQAGTGPNARAQPTTIYCMA